EGRSRISRREVPRLVPPGSRVSTTVWPAVRNAAASKRRCVDLPQPSMPSKVTKRDTWWRAPSSPWPADANRPVEGQSPRELSPKNEAHRVEELTRRERLGQVVVGTELVPLEQVLVLGPRRHEDDRDACELRVGANAVEHLHAAHRGHLDLEQDHVRAAPL